MRLLIFTIVVAVSSFAGNAAAAEIDFTNDVRPLLARYCYECHGEAKAKGDISLTKFADENAVLADRRVWKRAHEVIEAREMPPETAKLQPTVAEREKLSAWLEGLLKRPDPDGVRNPGHVVLRRLNQKEYNNTIYDLFRLNKPPTYFDPSRGTLPETIRLVLHRLQRPTVVTLPPDDVGYGYDNIGEILSLPPFLMEKYFTAARDVVELVATEGRSLAPRINPTRDRSGARAVLGSFLPRAFRRPVTDDETARYLALFDLATEKGETYDPALKVAVAAALVSPDFLFRVEQGDDKPDAVGIVALTDHELASRLSYFLWSSMPDDELLSAAAAGKLREPDALEAQARRLMGNRRAKELAENFALQWLQVTAVEGSMPDPDRFPAFYGKYLGTAMRQEALLLFEAVMIEDRSVLDLVDAPFTYLNETLARYYGIEPQQTGKSASLFWHRYELTDRRRGGALTLGAVLLSTSSSTRTSPVKRGKWILEALLGAPPPPPLPNVPDLDNAPVAADTLSLRERLEAHRSDPNCASCHRRMDPLGFGLENYDAIGQWRDRDGREAVDARGTLADGTSFDGPIELKDMLVGPRRGDFLRSLTEHMLTYALGRKLEYYDAPAVQEIVAHVEKHDYRFSALVAGIVRSYPFRYIKRAETEK